MESLNMTGFKYIRCQIMNMTLEEVANMLDVTPQTVFSWESKKKKLPQKRLEQINEFTGISKKFFLLDTVSDIDKLEIKKEWLNRELNDTKKEYADLLQSSDAYNEIALADMSLRVNRLIHELRQIMKDTNEQEQVLELVGVFKDIIKDNRQVKILHQVLRSLELFFSAYGKDDRLNVAEDLEVRGIVENESDLVYDLYNALSRNRRRMLNKEE